MGDKNMCPETNVVIVEPGKISKKTLLGIGIVLLLILGAACFLIYRSAVLRRIPELVRVDELEVDYYDVSFSSFDGKTYKYISRNSRTREESLALLDSVHKYTSTRGYKVNNWTADKITYPVYAVTIRPVKYKNEEFLTGDTVVWSNGYLFTASGDVYRCNPDFKPFMETDDNDFVREVEIDSISNIRNFRPLFYAGSGWNTDLLRPSGITEYEPAEGIEAEITEISERSGFPLVTILLRNTSEEDWHYEDYSLFVNMVVAVDGELYYLYHDPTIDDDIRTFPGYNEVLEAGSENTAQISLGFYGTLPPGDYKIIIYGLDGSDLNYVSVDYHL